MEKLLAQVITCLLKNHFPSKRNMADALGSWQQLSDATECVHRAQFYKEHQRSHLRHPPLLHSAPYLLGTSFAAGLTNRDAFIVEGIPVLLFAWFQFF